MTIHILAPDVAAKIAAGEVVERPANAAKELIENSLDAGANEVRVEIREGGRRLLRVIDTGHGMTAEDAPLAFARHATSKLQTADDLDRIATFGFRGEALYSIAAVSHITLLTRHKSEEFGLQLRLEGGEVVSQNRAGSPVGTSITIEHLFFNTPARAKFLRQPATEAGQIASVIQRYALAYPHVRFSLINEGKLVFQSNGSGDLFDVLVKVFGVEEAKQMVHLGIRNKGQDAEEQGFDLIEEVDFMGGSSRDNLHSPTLLLSQSPLVSGYTSLPSLNRPNRAGITLFVNRRYVEDRTITHAVVQAYHTLLPGGRFPLAVVLIELDPSLVDVNVHPQKTQVRFVEERRVFNAVQKAIRRAVIDVTPIPEMSVGVEEGGMRSELSPTSPLTPLSSTWSERRDLILNAGHQQQSFELYPSRTVSPAPEVDTEKMNGQGAAAPRSDETRRQGENETISQSPNLPSFPDNPPIRNSQSAIQNPKSTLPPLRVVGQIGAMYIVAEGPSGVYLIDQHAAHERILYEKFMEQRYGLVQGGVPKQHLLTPLTLHAGSALAGWVERYLDTLGDVGFEIEPFGSDTYLIRAVPSVLSGDDPLRSLEEIVL
ncbi:MAG: DNA mismatch repair endonuclease MutL, partial [Caldilineaceae bacterium]